MKVVVTGGVGFIGSHLTDALVAEGHEVHIVDNNEHPLPGRQNQSATHHLADIRNLDALEDIFKGATHVFHLAALPSVPYSIEQPIETAEINMNGTLNVLVAAQKNSVSRVVYSASSSAYGDAPTLPLSEDMPPQPKSPYAMQKYVGECVCKTWSDVYGIQTVSLRYFNVYGPRLDPESAYAAVLGIFLKQRKEGKPLTITGDGAQTRDFVHVSDVARANLLAATSPSVGRGEVINIGSGRNISIKELALLIGKEVAYIPARLEPHDSLADIRKARELLEWSPQVQLEEGITKLIPMFLEPNFKAQ